MDVQQTNLTEIIAVDINGLMKILFCGKPTALEMGERAKARISVSNKRILYSVDKVKTFVTENTY